MSTAKENMNNAHKWIGKSFNGTYQGAAWTLVLDWNPHDSTVYSQTNTILYMRLYGKFTAKTPRTGLVFTSPIHQGTLTATGADLYLTLNGWHQIPNPGRAGPKNLVIGFALAGYSENISSALPQWKVEGSFAYDVDGHGHEVEATKGPIVLKTN